MTFLRSRRVVLWFGVLLLGPMLCHAAQSKREDTSPGASLVGQLLVATPDMSDPRFRQTVILIVRHDKSGAFGIVLNRPLDDMPIAQLLKALGLDSKGSDGTVRLFAGGPVEPQIGFVVHSPEYRRPNTMVIDGRVAVTSSPQVLRDIGQHKGPRQALVAFGYAGWGAGQLEAELARGGWFTVPEDPALVFEVDRDKLWNEASKRRSISL